jgi:hypothetical protein
MTTKTFSTMTFDSDSRLPAAMGVLVAEEVTTAWFGRKTFYRAAVMFAQHHPEHGFVYVRKPVIDSEDYVTVWGDGNREAVEKLLADYMAGLTPDRDPNEKWTRISQQNYAWVAPEPTEAELADLDEVHDTSSSDWYTRRAEAGFGE